MSHEAMTVAKYIISYCNENKLLISNLKLQRMLYFLWINYYKLAGRYLFNDDICAWQLGPVVPNVYYEFCIWGGTPIRVDEFDRARYPELHLLDEKIGEWGAYSASYLALLSRQEVWREVYKNGAGMRSVIPFEMIIENIRKGIGR